LVNHNRAGFISGGNASLFFHVKNFAAAHPIERFLQQAHRQMTDRIVSLALPAKWAPLDMPEDFPIFFLDPDLLIRKFIKQFGKGFFAPA
jgi:hypothetical protein